MTKQIFSQQEIRNALQKIISERSNHGQLDHELYEMAIPSYLHWNPLVRWIIRERLYAINMLIEKDHVKIGGGGDIDNLLDFGCGLGLLGVLQSQNCKEITLTDIEIEPAKAIQKHYHIENAYPIDAKDFHWEKYRNSFDVVVAADVLEHVDHLDSYLKNISESLKENGRFYLSGPTESWFYGLCRKIAGFTGEYHQRNIFDIENLLKEKSWKMVEIKSIPWFLPFKMFRISVWQKNHSFSE